MDLDKRILPGKRPLTCFDAEEAKQFIGKKGFVTDELNKFRDLNKTQECTLKNVWPNETYCFVSSVTGYKYFLPAGWVKPEKPENKWRPFTLDEFVKRFDLDVGTRVFLIRSKRTPENQKRLLLTGIIQDKDPALCGIGLGPYFFNFSELFLFHEVKIGERDWQPFGVEDASE